VKVGYGRIVRDEEGNVVDIIIVDESEPAEDEDEEMKEDERVEGKTDNIVRCESDLAFSQGHGC